MRVCRAYRVQDEQDKQDERSRQDKQDERNRQDEQDEQDERNRQDERSAYGPLFYLSFLDCSFCEHILCKKNTISRLQGRFSPLCATRWLLPKNVNMLLNSLSH